MRTNANLSNCLMNARVHPFPSGACSGSIMVGKRATGWRFAMVAQAEPASREAQGMVCEMSNLFPVGTGRAWQ